MSFLVALAASLVEWAVVNIGSLVIKFGKLLWAKEKSDSALSSNAQALTDAEKTGDKAAIAAAGENSLDNNGGN